MSARDMRKSTSMTQMEFAEYFGIPRRTLQDWESGARKAPDYLLRLMEYKLRAEELIKEGGGHDGMESEKTVKKK